ncbi:hypothetical protein EH165_01910 [Nakamurella antarctica]|uniref:TPM domain-containing protein n=1 Tax=Nakamurella antarctica TaxID=1902245 RepID=A0A3G8ZJS9_9ACTN|nr:TPM domain-containing protein [Nakamurella antarctica]AZI57105.1 hypothetical protein EH165_01910 [Nakamurella antarctica]
MKTFSRLGAALIATLLWLSLVVGTALASVTLTDNAGVLSASESAAIQSAAAQIDKVNVVVVTLNGGSTDLKKQLVALKEKGGWGGTDWLSNSVILAVDVQSRRLAVFYGSAAESKVGSAETAIGDAMGNEFSSSAWGAGLLAGVDKVASTVKTSYTWLWVLLALGALILVYMFVKLIKRRRAAAVAKELERSVIAQNQLAMVDLRQKVDQLTVLMGTVPPGAAQQSLQSDLNDIDVALAARESRSAVEVSEAGTNHNAEKQLFATLSLKMGSIANRLSLLRQDSGWREQWQSEISAARQMAIAVGTNQGGLIDQPGFSPLDIAPLENQLAQLLPQVLENQLPIADGLAQLTTISKQIWAKRSEIDSRLAELETARRAELSKAKAKAEAEARRRNSQWDDDDNSHGSGGWMGGGYGGWSGSARSRGSGSFGGAVLGGILGGMLGSGGSRSGGGGFGGGGGGSRGFSGGGGHSGGGSRGF